MKILMEGIKSLSAGLATVLVVGAVYCGVGAILALVTKSIGGSWDWAVFVLGPLLVVVAFVLLGILGFGVRAAIRERV